ncbi:MAG: LPS export ABC transporter periplasmic protein LptC [Pseudomonadota bacterium]
MLLSIQRVFGLLTLLTISAASLTGCSGSNEAHTADSHATTEQTPSGYIKHATIYSFTPEGTLESQIQSPSIERFTAQDKMLLKSPTIDYVSQHHYTLTAGSGTLLKKQHLTLKEGVLIRQHNSNQAMQSQSFNIDLINKTLTSTHSVSIQSAEGRTVSQGLNANLDEQVVHLTNRVRGVYEP